MECRSAPGLAGTRVSMVSLGFDERDMAVLLWGCCEEDMLLFA